MSSYNLEAEIGDVTDYLNAANIDSVFMTAMWVDAPAVFVAADRFPGTFRGVFLENPIDPGSANIADPARDLAAAFNRFIKLCLDDPICGPAFPNMASDRTALIERADASPASGTVTVRGLGGRWLNRVTTSQSATVLLDGARTTEAQSYALWFPVTFGLIPLSQTDTGGAFSSVAGEFSANMELSERAVGAAFLSYSCAVLSLNTNHEVSNRALPTFATIDDTTLPERCKIWDVPLLGREFFSPTTGATPTLIAVGELAPNPAATWAESLQRTRPNTTVITFPTLGQFIGAFAPNCYQMLIQTFVLDPTAALDVTSCEAQSPAITFVTGSQ